MMIVKGRSEEWQGLDEEDEDARKDVKSMEGMVLNKGGSTEG